jgi:hypothetical protein
LLRLPNLFVPFVPFAVLNTAFPKFYPLHTIH